MVHSESELDPRDHDRTRSPDSGGARGLLHVKSTASGVAASLEVEGLAPTSPGQRYELWFAGPGDSLQKPNRISARYSRACPQPQSRERSATQGSAR